jgi:succinate dehydrogenase / fumarate reductase cytochrome b subunit
MADARPAAGRRARPLSPHLQIYTLSISMLNSILHRITGAALYVGTLLLAWWLIAIAQGAAYYRYVNDLLGHPIGKLILLGYTWALIHHMLGGIRHLYWDTGRGFDLGTVDRLSWSTLIGSILLTALVWFIALRLRGAI